MERQGWWEIPPWWGKPQGANAEKQTEADRAEERGGREREKRWGGHGPIGTKRGWTDSCPGKK